MLRRCLNVISVLSLLLCVAASAFWVRSYWVGDFIGRERTDVPPWPKIATSSTGFFSGRGQMAVGRTYGTHMDWKGFFGSGKAIERHESHLAWRSAKSRHFEFSMPGVAGTGLESQWLWKRGGVYIAKWYFPYDTGSGGYWAICLPDWLIVSVLLVLPLATSLRVATRWYRAAPGHCATCGYDLRASPNRCPECGAGVSGETSKAS